MRSSFDNIIETILEHEGGYVDHKDDRGGETNFGISSKYHPDIDIKNLTREQATEIYYKRYWIKNKISTYPENIQKVMFDMTVNMGNSRAVKILQQAVNQKTRRSTLKVDGKFGKKTLRAVTRNKIELDRIQMFRAKFYFDIIRRNPSQKSFMYGWFKRAIQV
mgnify:CR=1 FL=1